MIWTILEGSKAIQAPRTLTLADKPFLVYIYSCWKTIGNTKSPANAKGTRDNGARMKAYGKPI